MNFGSALATFTASFVAVTLHGCGGDANLTTTAAATGGTTTTVTAPGALDINDLTSAFQSNDGLTLRVAHPGERNASWPVSTTVWRNDLPLALYGPPGLSPSDTAGVVFTPGRSSGLCAFPIDANTITRTSADNASLKDACGVSRKEWTDGVNSGECKFTTAEEYVSAYYYKPLVSLLGMDQLWTLEFATCHFKKVPLMLDAQKLLLQRSMSTPPNATDDDWLNNATKPGFGLTAFNEVMNAPYDESAIGGMFWAHSGPFRDPRADEYGACQIAKYLKSLPSGETPLPIFELAGVNLERPFLGCNIHAGLKPDPSSDCLSRGFGEWQANITGDGPGRSSANVFRTLSKGVFQDIKLVCASEEAHAVFV